MNLSRQQVLEMATIEQSKPDPKSRWIDFEFGDGKTGLVRVFANQKRTQPARVRAQAKEIGQRPSPLAMLAEPKPGTDQYGVSLEVLRGEIDPNELTRASADDLAL